MDLVRPKLGEIWFEVAKPGAADQPSLLALWGLRKIRLQLSRGLQTSASDITIAQSILARCSSRQICNCNKVYVSRSLLLNGTGTDQQLRNRSTEWRLPRLFEQLFGTYEVVTTSTPIT